MMLNGRYRNWQLIAPPRAMTALTGNKARKEAQTNCQEWAGRNSVPVKHCLPQLQKANQRGSTRRRGLRDGEGHDDGTDILSEGRYPAPNTASFCQEEHVEPRQRSGRIDGHGAERLRSASRTTHYPEPKGRRSCGLYQQAQHALQSTSRKSIQQVYCRNSSKPGARDCHVVFYFVGGWR